MQANFTLLMLKSKHGGPMTVFAPLTVKLSRAVRAHMLIRLMGKTKIRQPVGMDHPETK